MGRVLYLSHPEVVIDPQGPVPDWGLSDQGRARLSAALARGWPGAGWRIVTSPEVKARQTAAMIAATTNDPVRTHPDMGEVDRSSTGYLPFDQHEALADALFANPAQGPQGWEGASAAQARIVTAFEALLAESPGDLLLVGHGGVGTFLWCHLAGEPIARRHDQPCCGCFWTWCGDRDVRPLAGWQMLEDARRP